MLKEYIGVRGYLLAGSERVHTCRWLWPTRALQQSPSRASLSLSSHSTLGKQPTQHHDAAGGGGSDDAAEDDDGGGGGEDDGTDEC